MTQHPDEGTLHAYIDGELSQADASALEAHVGGCSPCAAALAEARGFVAAASRVITTLDAAPSSAARPAAPIVARPPAPARRAVRPPIFRVPYARAAALLLLVGGTAFVVDRTGTFERGKTPQAESLMADAAAGSDLAATAPVEAATTPTTASTQAPEAAAAGADRSTGARDGATGNAGRESVAPRRVAAGVVTQNAAPAIAQASILAGKEAEAGAAKATALPAAPPPPAVADMRAERIVVTSALGFAPTVVRYRTREGVIVMLAEEPLRTSFAEESAATRQSAPAPARRRMAAPMAATPINSYRWSDVERGRIYTLSGPLTVAELEALSKRLNELERLP